MHRNFPEWKKLNDWSYFCAASGRMGEKEKKNAQVFLGAFQIKN